MPPLCRVHYRYYTHRWEQLNPRYILPIGIPMGLSRTLVLHLLCRIIDMYMYTVYIQYIYVNGGG